MAKKVHLFILGEKLTMCGRRMSAAPGHTGHYKAMMPYPGMSHSKELLCLLCKKKHESTLTPK